jgi:DtxR family Mn-dependent transcriptional regulator
MLTGKRLPPGALSPSHEHYLRAIWDVRERFGYARVTDVAQTLGISHATLSTGLRALEERGLVGHDSHRFLVLSETGERVAREVHHRHSVLRRFLHGILGVDAEIAEREACLMEHDVGPETTERLVDFIRLLHEDDGLRAALQSRLSRYHRTCAPGDECGACGLGCLTAAPGA